jgi:hypothetical protein
MRETEHHRDVARSDQIFGVHPWRHEATAYEKPPPWPMIALDYIRSLL